MRARHCLERASVRGVYLHFTPRLCSLSSSDQNNLTREKKVFSRFTYFKNPPLSPLFLLPIAFLSRDMCENYSDDEFPPTNKRLKSNSEITVPLIATRSARINEEKERLKRPLSPLNDDYNTEIHLKSKDAIAEALGLGSAERRLKWFQHVQAPLLYDFILSKKVYWPSECIQWCPLEANGMDLILGDDDIQKSGNPNQPQDQEQRQRKLAMSKRQQYLQAIDSDNKCSSMNFGTYKNIIYSERYTGTDDHALILATIRVGEEHLTKVNEVSKKWSFDAAKDTISSSDFKVQRKINHPGEVNKIRAPKDGIVLTSSDDPDLFVWDFKKLEKQKKSKPDKCVLTLKGHSGNVGFALDTKAFPSDIHVAAGGEDEKVLIWSLQANDLGSSRHQAGTSITNMQTEGGECDSYLENITSLRGHTAIVNSVCFSALDHNSIGSVSDDQSLRIWDTRDVGRNAKIVVHDAHDGDVVCLDWCPYDSNLILTGGSDSVIRLWDLRKLSNTNKTPSFVNMYDDHRDNVYAVQWNPHVKGIFASSSTDRYAMVWDINKKMKDKETSKYDRGKDSRKTSNQYYNPQLIFTHAGHFQGPVVDLQWSLDNTDPWVMCSVSTDFDGGSTMQTWRMSDFVYKSSTMLKKEISDCGIPTF